LAGKIFEIAFALAGKVNSSFNSAFGSANGQLEQMNDNAAELQGQSNGLAAKLTGVGKAAAGIAVAVGTAALAIGGLAVVASDDLQKSLNGVQSSTGVADEAMGGMRETMLAIYNNNFGENFGEIGKALERIGQQSGLSGKELQKMTEDAFSLRDTFEMDINGSVDTATIMMKNFGINSTEAFNLIAQGAQSGLNKNDDLLEIIAEYGPHFAKLGFSAEEAMNMLSSGAKGGVFSVDQLGDVVHEFGRKMREEDLSEPLQELGLNSEKYTGMVAKGGETAKKAFRDIAEKVAAIEDPVKRNQIGIGIFGDMMGEVGIEGVLAMSKTEGSINKTTDALGKINSVKYNTFSETLTGIKRNLETSLLIPLGEQIMPKMNEFSGWITAHMPAIKNEIGYAFAVVLDNAPLIVTAVGTIAAGFTAYGIVLVATKTATIAMTVAQNTQKGAMVAYNIVVGLSTAAQWGYLIAVESGSVGLGVIAAAQWAFNAALSANPIGVVILSVAALGLGIYELVKHFDSIKAAIKSAWEWLNKWNSTPAKDAPFIGGNTTTAPFIGTPKSTPFGGYTTPTPFGGRTPPTPFGGVVKHALGGIMTSPHLGLVAEAGAEAIVPLTNRRRGLEVWSQAGQALGVGGGSGDTINVTFAPVINGAGPEIIPALKEQQKDFMAKLKETLHQQRRVSYG